MFLRIIVPTYIRNQSIKKCKKIAHYRISNGHTFFYMTELNYDSFCQIVYISLFTTETKMYR